MKHFLMVFLNNKNKKEGANGDSAATHLRVFACFPVTAHLQLGILRAWFKHALFYSSTV